MILRKLLSMIVIIFTSTITLATTDFLVASEMNYSKTSNDLTIYGDLGDSNGYYTYRGINYYNKSDIKLRYVDGYYTASYGSCYAYGGPTYARDWTSNSEYTWNSYYTTINGSISIFESIREADERIIAYGKCPSTDVTIKIIKDIQWWNPSIGTWDSSITYYNHSDVTFTADTTPPRIQSDIYSWEMQLGNVIPDLVSSVEVFDKFDNNPSISVDTSKVNINRAGLYTITYTVSDRYGNSAKVDGAITVIDSTSPSLTVEESHVYIRVKTGEWGYSVDEMTNTEKPDWEKLVKCSDDDERGCTLTNNVSSQVTWSTVNSGYQVLYIFSDQSGNLSYESIIIHVIDDIAPTIIESDIYSWEMNLGDEIPDLVTGVKVVDNTDDKSTIKVDTSKVNVNKAGVYTITYTVSDKYGNTAHINGSITVNDTVPPELTKNVSHIYIRVDTNEWGYSLDNIIYTTTPDWNSFITCKDNDVTGCTLINNIQSQIDWNTVSAGYNVYYNFKDNSGNIVTNFITVHVIDDTAPAIVDTDIYSWEMNIGEAIPDLITGVTLYDKWDSMPIISVDTSQINIYKAGVYTITYYVEDKYGNGEYIEGSITVNDINPPELTKNISHLYIRVGTGEWGYSLNSMIYTTIPEWNTFITCKDDSEVGCYLVNDIAAQVDWNTVNPGFQVIYIFSDASGNEISQMITIHVIDDTPPNIENSDVLDEWQFIIGTEITEDMLKDNIIINDNTDDNAYIEWVDFSNVNTYSAGIYTITYYVTDSFGNTVEYVGTVTIIDITPPTLTKNVDRIYIRVGTGEWGYTLDNIVFTDTPSWYSFITCTDDDEAGCYLVNDISSQIDWNNLNVGYQVVYIFSDTSGNEMSQTITIHVIDDRAPTIEGSNINDWIFNIGTEITEYMLKENVVVIDDTDKYAYIEWIDFSSVNVNSAGVYEIIYHIADSSGNSGVAYGNITINDVKPPTLVRNVNRIYIRVGTNEWGYTLDDIRNIGEPDWESFVTCSDDDEKGCTLINDLASQVEWNVVNSGYQVIYNYSDPSGNLVNQAVTVHVVDDIAPIVNVDNDISVDIDDLDNYDWSKHITITDNYYTDGFSIDVDISDLVGVNANNSVITNYISYSVTDKAGNTFETGKIEVNLIDKTPPMVELTDDFIYVLRTDSNHDFSKYIINVYDNSGMTLDDFNIVYSTISNGYLKYASNTIYIDISSIDFTIPQNYNIVYYITDASGNTYISKGIIVTISNFAGNVEHIPTLTDTSGNYSFEYNSTWDIYQGVTAYDRYGNSVVNDVQVAMTYYDGADYYEKNEIDWTKIGTYTLVYYYIDKESAIGFELGRRTIKIVDTQSPEIDGYFDIRIKLGDELTREHLLEGVTAIDDYDGDITENIVVSGLSSLSIGSNTITLSVEDFSGNSTTKSISVYVEARETFSKYSLLLGITGVVIVGGFVYVKSKASAL